MTEALATLFEGKEIHIVEETGEVWFPLPDLSEAWGIDKNTLPHQLDRNPDMFSGMHDDKYVTYSTGGIQVPCVNERGLYLLIGRVNTKRLKNPVAAEAILRFQRWVPELIQQYRKKEIVQVRAAPPLDAELQTAKKIADLTGTDLRTMQAAALRKCGLKEYADALTPAITHGETATWLTPSQIGARCGHTAHEINNYLSFHRFQYRDQTGLWRLTDKGEPHGEEYWFEAASKHREVRIRWRESILTASGLIKEIPGQSALPAHV